MISVCGLTRLIDMSPTSVIGPWRMRLVSVHLAVPPFVSSGFYMFWAIPLVSGDLRWNDGKKSIEGGASFFTDQVGIEELQTALLKIAETRNCDLAEVSYFDGDASYAGPSYGGAVGSCFGSSHMSVSAILVPRKAANKEGK